MYNNYQVVLSLVKGFITMTVRSLESQAEEFGQITGREAYDTRRIVVGGYRYLSYRGTCA